MKYNFAQLQDFFVSFVCNFFLGWNLSFHIQLKNE